MPQMSPVLWVVFPFVVVMLGVMVMVIGMEEGVEIESELLGDLNSYELKW